MTHANLLVFAIILLMGLSVSAGSLVEIKGRVLRIENGEAVIKTVDGENRIAMKRLSKEDTKKVVMASGKKKEVSLSLAPQALQKASH